MFSNKGNVNKQILRSVFANISRLSVISGERQLKEFSTFLQHHHKTLNHVISGNSIINITNNLIVDGINTVLVNADKEALRLQQSSSVGINSTYPTEFIATMDLIQSDNKGLNKTIGVFIELCTEVRTLCSEGIHLFSNIISAKHHFRKISHLL